MTGNVWEVTADFYRPGHDPADKDTPRGAEREPMPTTRSTPALSPA